MLLALSVGCLLLGMGFVGWALTNIRAQSVPSHYVYDHSVPSAVATTAQPAASRVASSSPKPLNRRRTQQGAAKIVYSKHPSEGDTLGSLSIPALGKTIPIIQGTRSDDLRKGVGHFAQSVLPGQKDNCVLSGHRDTVFSGLGALKTGDEFVVQTARGDYTYRIKRIRIVHADDRTVIVPTNHAVLTVTTCYPFDFIGSAPDRYVLSADLVSGR